MVSVINMLIIGLISVGMSDIREPSPSLSGETVVFCFRGDIWEASLSGGIMRCLVPGSGTETSPCYSPDGRLIAFTSNRTGGGDVYMMNASGGTSTRLTYHAGLDRMLCWSATSDSVYFQSSREGGNSWVYSVSITGGTPSPVARVEIENICLLPGGLAIERGCTRGWRKHYSGSASRKIWTGSGTDWELPDASELDSRWPMYSPRIDELLFVREDPDGHAAIWSMQPGQEPLQRTFLTEGDITFPAINSSGETITFEFNGGIRCLKIPEWSIYEVLLIPGMDYPFPLEHGELVGYSTDCFDIASSGTQIAVVGTGDIFAGTLEDDDIENIVQVYSGAWRARDPAWSPDGSTLVFTLEHDGSIQLAQGFPDSIDSLLVDSAFPEIDILPTASDVADKPVWAPDGERISYLDRDGRLRVFNVVTRLDNRVCDIPDIIHHSWSPDSRWLAFSVPVLAHREEVYVVPSDGGEPRNISRHPNDDFQPFWPSDGRRILYASRTDDGDYSIKQVWFSREAWDGDSDTREGLLDRPVSRVDIEWEGLQRRTETLCTVEGYYDFYGASPDGRIIAFPGWDDRDRMDLWSVDWKGESLQRITFSGEFPEKILVNDEGDIYYISISGSIRRVSTDGGMIGSLGWHMPVWRSIAEIQAQKFDVGLPEIYTGVFLRDFPSLFTHHTACLTNNVGFLTDGNTLITELVSVFKCGCKNPSTGVPGEYSGRDSKILSWDIGEILLEFRMSHEGRIHIVRRIGPFHASVQSLRILPEYHYINIRFLYRVPRSPSDEIEWIAFEGFAGSHADIEIEMLPHGNDGTVINKPSIPQGRI